MFILKKYDVSKLELVGLDDLTKINWKKNIEARLLVWGSKTHMHWNHSLSYCLSLNFLFSFLRFVPTGPHTHTNTHSLSLLFSYNLSCVFSTHTYKYSLSLSLCVSFTFIFLVHISSLDCNIYHSFCPFLYSRVYCKGWSFLSIWSEHTWL